jgi:type II secretory ATPase GspE/PulE/Tfp pilus assembly ATPase PilB-like protein
LTGHLVFTTLHTNDAPTAFTRLEEMGIEPFLTASSTLAVVAQRLARRICQNCKVKAEPDPSMTGFFGCREDALPTTFKGKGCIECAGTGYKGRVGIYELMVMGDELRRTITEGAKTDAIRECAVKNGMMPLQKYAEYLVREGLTTVEAVMAVVSVSESKEEEEDV